MTMPLSEVENLFRHHPPPDEATAHAHEQIRGFARQLGQAIRVTCPDSPERDQALLKAREAMMWANSAIAIHSDRLPGR